MTYPTTTYYAADLFCGAGGTSTGATLAAQDLGAALELVAINHNPVKIAAHHANHPTTSHFCQPIDGVTPASVIPHGRLDVLYASPSCKPFSSNNSGRPVTAQERALCWSVLPWLATLDVDTLFLENVPAFEQSGPLTKQGLPDPTRKGEEFQAFLAAIRALGYMVDYRIVNAADYGDPQERNRLVLLARRGDEAPVWPERTHGPGTGQAWRTAREILDWDDVGEPAHRKRYQSAYVPDMIKLGLAQFDGEPFLIPRQQGKNRFVRSVDRPIQTVVASAPTIGLVQVIQGVPHHRYLSMTEYKRAMGFPESYQLAGTKRQQYEALGDAVPVNLARAFSRALFTAPSLALAS